jgi:hypothetical protein
VFDAFTDSLWAGPVLWMMLYISDYYLTIASARLYRAQDKIVFEGSYEITPIFQADVNALRSISPRFIVMLAATTGCLFLFTSTAESEEMHHTYVIILGAMCLLEVTVHMRHLHNLFLFGKGLSALKGRLEYPRGLILRISALDILLYAGLYAFLFAATGSSFILGGTIACTALAINHYRLARRHGEAVSKTA